MLVDDDPLIIRSLQAILEEDGHAVTTATGGQEGIDTLSAAAARDEQFAVVITDLGMPYVDGRKVASAVKARSDTPVILLTGWGQRLMEDDEIPANVDRVLSKPPKLYQLRAALSELVPESSHGPQSIRTTSIRTTFIMYPNPTMTPNSIATLLIVDDEAAQMKALHDTLETEGYVATGFTSAAAALAALREQTFDLVLTDLKMPEMTGVEFLRAAFAIDPTMAGVVMTGHGSLDSAVQAMQAGAHDYILKPFRLSAILPVLARCLAVRQVRMENVELHQAVGMYELSKAVGLALDFETVLGKVADTALAQNGVRAVAVLLASGKGSDELHVAAARGENADAILEMRVGLSEQLSAWLALHLEPEPPSRTQIRFGCAARRYPRQCLGGNDGQRQLCRNSSFRI